MSCTRVIDFWHEGKNLQWYSMTDGHYTNTYYFKGGFAVMVWL